MTTTKANKTLLRQVLLVEDGGSRQDVFWIDNAVARKGARVVDEAGKRWRVAEVYNVRSFEDVDRQIRVWSDFAKTLEGK